MGKIESPLGSRTFESSQGTRHYIVDDANAGEDNSNYDEDYIIPERKQEPQPRRITVEEAMAMRQQKLAAGYRPSEAARRRIEMLIGIGRQTRDVSVGESTFSLRTLKSKEMRNLMQLASELAKSQDPDAIYAIREASLAMSIFAVDGVDINVVLEVSNEDDKTRMAAKKLFLNEMDEHTLNYIYRQHEELMSESSKKFGIHTADDAKEVAEQIKKSG